MSITGLASRIAFVCCLLLTGGGLRADDDPAAISPVTPKDDSLTARFEAPASVPQFDIAEFTVRLDEPPGANPFTEIEFTGDFSVADQPLVRVNGFCDAQDGRVFRLRFCPDRPVAYHYVLKLRCRQQEQTFAGDLTGTPSNRSGPVIVDPEHPKHFLRRQPRTVLPPGLYRIPSARSIQRRRPGCRYDSLL